MINKESPLDNERERAKLLKDYKILDTLPEPMYDDITTMAAAISNAPIALISLIDNHRQFFKSHYGITSNQTSIEDSVCSYAIRSGKQYFEISDLRTDDRFKNFPMVTGGPKIVSYFGVPLVSEEGIPFGTLSVINTKIHGLTALQRKTIISLAQQVVYMLELRKKNHLLEAYRKKLESHSQNMEEFAFIAAHDLRAPLRVITSFLKLLESKNGVLWDEKDKQYFEFIFENTQRMDKLVIDLLNYAKSHMNHVSNESVDTQALVSSIFETLTKGNTNMSAELILTGLPHITSSEIALTIIFQNLIDNALKYQSKNSIAKIEVNCVETDSGCEFQIKDNGIGMDEENLSLIFHPFKRLHNQSEYTGSGLGLAACRKIIETLGGSISVKSEKNKGSIFKVTLPK